MLRIYFKKSNPYGSSINRADQISDYLRSLGYMSQSLYDVEHVRDGIIIFVKFMKIDELERVKRRNNIVIYDCVDALATGENELSPEHALLIDGIIFPTKKMLNEYKEQFKGIVCEVIYHHYDPKIIYPEKPHNIFRLGYIGSREGLLYDDEIEELEIVLDFQKQIINAPAFSCHYSIRKEGSKEFFYKPNSKVSTAAACRANIILTRESVHLELLGNDYPYFSGSDLSSVLKTVNFAKGTFNGPEWRRGLEFMEMVRYRTNIGSITNDYLAFLSNFEQGPLVQVSSSQNSNDSSKEVKVKNEIHLTQESGSKYRIMHINWMKWPDYKGGHVIHVSSLINELEKLNCKQAYLYSGYGDSSGKIGIKKYQRDGEDIDFYEVLNTGTHFEYPLDEISMPDIEDAVIDAVRDYKPDIIHVHHMRGFTADTITKLKAKFSIPVVVTLRDYWYLCPWIRYVNFKGENCDDDRNGKGCEECFYNHFHIPSDEVKHSGLAEEFLKRKKEWIKVLNAVDSISVVSPFLKKLYIKKGINPDKMRVITAGIPLIINNKRVKQKKEDNTLRMGFLGSFDSSKGAELILDFFKSCNNHDITLEIWGNISEKFKDQVMNDSRIRYNGNYRREDIGKMLSDIDIGIVASLWHDTAPQTIFEFFANRVPVIASNRGGISDFVIHEQNGLIFDPGDSQNLKEAIIRLKDDSAFLKRLSNNIQSQKTVEAYAREILDFYDKANAPEEEKLLDFITEANIRVLIVGCGDGTMGKKLLQRGASEVVGIETDVRVCEKAKENLSKVVCGSIENINGFFEEKYFDCVVLENALEGVNEPVLTLKNIKKYIKETGVVIASIANARHYSHINLLVEGNDTPDMHSSNNYHNAFTGRDIKTLFKKAGFEITGICEKIDPEYAALEDPYSGEVAFGRVTLKCLTPEDLRDIFVEKYIVRAEKAGHKVKQVDKNISMALDSGNLKEAKEIIERYLELHSVDMDMLYRHAEICFKLEKYDSAMESLQKILIFYPERKDALKLKEKISKKQRTVC